MSENNTDWIVILNGKELNVDNVDLSIICDILNHKTDYKIIITTKGGEEQ